MLVFTFVSSPPPPPHTHTHTLLLFSFFFCKDGSDWLMKRVSYSRCSFLCIVLVATYLKYRRYRLSCLPFVWHFFFHFDTRTHRKWLNYWQNDQLFYRIMSHWHDAIALESFNTLIFYQLINCFLHCRYFLRVTATKRITDIVREKDVLVHTLSSYPDINNRCECVYVLHNRSHAWSLVIRSIIVLICAHVTVRVLVRVCVCSYVCACVYVRDRRWFMVMVTNYSQNRSTFNSCNFSVRCQIELNFFALESWRVPLFNSIIFIGKSWGHFLWLAALQPFLDLALKVLIAQQVLSNVSIWCLSRQNLHTQEWQDSFFEKNRGISLSLIKSPMSKQAKGTRPHFFFTQVQTPDFVVVNGGESWWWD